MNDSSNYKSFYRTKKCFGLTSSLPLPSSNCLFFKWGFHLFLLGLSVFRITHSSWWRRAFPCLRWAPGMIRTLLCLTLWSCWSGWRLAPLQSNVTPGSRSVQKPVIIIHYAMQRTPKQNHHHCSQKNESLSFFPSLSHTIPPPLPWDSDSSAEWGNGTQSSLNHHWIIGDEKERTGGKTIVNHDKAVMVTANEVSYH